MKLIKITALLLSVCMPLTACSASAATMANVQTVEQSVLAAAEPAVPMAETAPVAEAAKPVFTNRMAGNEEALNEAVDAIAKANGVYGGSVAAFEHDQIVYTHSYGTADQRNGVNPANDDTRYRIASISKMVTAMLVMSLYDQDKVSLEDDIAQKILPALQNPYHPDDKTTVKMLMTHTSGIVDGAGYNNALGRYPFPSLESLLQMGNIYSGAKPGTAYSYSNFGAGLLAAVVEQGSGEHFYDYAQDTLFGPMGLAASYGMFTDESRENVAAFRGTDPLSWNYPVAYGNIPLGQMYLLGHGDLYVSASDLARLCMVLAGDGTYEGQRYLSQEAVDLINTSYVYDEETNVTRGLTVQISDEIIEGVTLYGHQGNAYNAISCAFYDPETEKGVVFLTNGASQERVESKVYRVNDSIVKEVWKYL